MSSALFRLFLFFSLLISTSFAVQCVVGDLYQYQVVTCDGEKCGNLTFIDKPSGTPAPPPAVIEKSFCPDEQHPCPNEGENEKTIDDEKGTTYFSCCKGDYCFKPPRFTLPPTTTVQPTTVPTTTTTTEVITAPPVPAVTVPPVVTRCYHGIPNEDKAPVTEKECPGTIFCAKLVTMSFSDSVQKIGLVCGNPLCDPKNPDVCSDLSPEPERVKVEQCCCMGNFCFAKDGSRATPTIDQPGAQPGGQPEGQGYSYNHSSSFASAFFVVFLLISALI